MKKLPIKSTRKKSAKIYFLRIALYLGILALLLIPSYIAAATYTAKKNAPVVDIHTVYDAMTLAGPTSYVQEASAKQNTALFSIFTTLCQHGEEVVYLPDRFYDGHYVATMSSADTTDVYHFYFSTEERMCYYVTPAEKIFRTDHELIPEFLGGTYAFEMYGASALPVLTTAATDEVTPFSVSWSYRTTDGTFVKREQTATTVVSKTYPIANDISFYFSLQPTSHEILIRRNGTLLYSGTSDGISLPLQDNEILDFEIRATYAPSSEKDYYGELIYRFEMQVVEAAHFSPSTTQLAVGDILILRCENVKNVEKLVVSTTPASDAAPVIFRRGDYVYAAIPATSLGTKNIRVTYGTVADSFDVTVHPTANNTHNASADELGGDWSTLLSKTIPSLIAQLGAKSDSGLTPRTITALPYEQIYAFGDTVALPNTQLAELPLPFHLFRASGTVGALAAGRVQYAGTHELLGNYVIVDHGCGLYTWYAGLAELRVVAGDVLAVGDTVGLASTTLYHEESVLIMATLGKAAVSLAQLCDIPTPLPE